MTNVDSKRLSLPNRPQAALGNNDERAAEGKLNDRHPVPLPRRRYRMRRGAWPNTKISRPAGLLNEA